MPKIIERESDTLGAKIFDRRKALGLTQSQLAELCEISQSRIAEIETGKTEDPGVNTVRRIAEALETTVDGLLDGKHPKARKRHKATA